ncbi:hypothetical protein KUCAC02_004005 [Chaenocephalus aceratus]|uniref:Uncharacterized protein n=1 Tax=Chaenocephalus aceratus TaxID=36190 RepID=A0ACB9WX94_CHAAC|nr:hypothetical protein KUCAC02_004005 [Chaenocephalus aceratus]
MKRGRTDQSTQHLSLVDRARASSVCWNDIFHTPDLWRRSELELSQPATSYLSSTHPDLIQQIIRKHAKHLHYVSFKMDGCTESAEAACDILSQLGNCTIKTLGLISTARPSFMDVSQAHFASALAVVFVNSKSLSSIKIDDTLVGDPSLKCHGLRELALNYHLLSEELLLALSSEKHVHLEHLRIDLVSENPGQTQFHTLQRSSWEALDTHLKVNIVMYFYLIEEEFDAFFRDETPVTQLYFGRAVSKEMLGRVGLNCPRLVELVVCANGECEVTCSSFVEFVKMCGGRLTQLSIMEEVLIPDSSYNIEQIHSEMPKHLGRMWFPDMMPTW